jgi:hypothetical protein
VVKKTAVNPSSRSIAFAKVPAARLADLRSKRDYSLITTGQGIKIPNKLFDPLFFVWTTIVSFKSVFFKSIGKVLSEIA